MKYIPPIRSIKDLILHGAIILGIGITLLLGFFYIYLPVYTNHGESLTVPDLQGMELSELDEFLVKRKLNFEILPDSGFSSEYPPLAVLQQNPKPGAKVKEYRKIYVSLNATNPPDVKVPTGIIDGSLKNAMIVLESYGLEVGDIDYEPYEFQNAVLQMRHKGERIKEGSMISKGSQIDLVVGDGAGKPFAVPEVVGMDLESARFVILGSGLKIGTIRENFKSEEAPGTVTQQFPEAGKQLRSGQIVDLWVSSTEEENIIDE